MRLDVRGICGRSLAVHVVVAVAAVVLSMVISPGAPFSELTDVAVGTPASSRDFWSPPVVEAGFGYGHRGMYSLTAEDAFRVPDEAVPPRELPDVDVLAVRSEWKE